MRPLVQATLVADNLAWVQSRPSPAWWLSRVTVEATATEILRLFRGGIIRVLHWQPGVRRKVRHSHGIARRVAGRRIELLRRTHHTVGIFQLDVSVLVMVERPLRSFVHEVGFGKLEAFRVHGLLSEILHLLLLVRMLGLLVLGIELRNGLKSKSIVAVVTNVGEGCATHHLILVRPCLTLVGWSPGLVLDELWFVGRKLWCVHLLLWVVHVTEQRAS